MRVSVGLGYGILPTEGWNCSGIACRGGELTGEFPRLVL